MPPAPTSSLTVPGSLTDSELPVTPPMDTTRDDDTPSWPGPSGRFTVTATSLVPSSSETVKRNVSSSPIDTSSTLGSWYDSCVSAFDVAFSDIVNAGVRSTTTVATSDSDAARPPAPLALSQETVALLLTSAVSRPTESVSALRKTMTIVSPTSSVGTLISRSSPSSSPLTTVPLTLPPVWSTDAANSVRYVPITSITVRSYAADVELPRWETVSVYSTASPASPLAAALTYAAVLLIVRLGATISTSNDALWLPVT